MNFAEKKWFKNMVWSPSEYEKAAVLANEIGEEMLARLDWMTAKPKVILDVGCGTGIAAIKLKERYQESVVIAIDETDVMLQNAREKYGLRLPWICARGEALPLPNQSVDLIYANFIVPWHIDFTQLLREWRRVLRPDGLLLFSALGPDTLHEWHSAFGKEGIPQLIDLHDLGDALLQEGFADPVLDISRYTMTYGDRESLLYELSASGMLFPDDFASTKKNAALVAPHSDDRWAVTYEVIYAHAFSPSTREKFSSSTDGEVRIPLSHLRRQLV